MTDLSNTNLDKDVKESGAPFEAMPAGNYKAVIVGDELKDNSKGTGKLLTFQWQIIEGDFVGKTLPDRLNIQHTNEVAQRIGQGQLKRICNLCNVQYPISNTEVLYGIPVMLFVKETKFESNKEAGKMLKGNEIAGYNPVPKEQPNNQSSNGGNW